MPGRSPGGDKGADISDERVQTIEDGVKASTMQAAILAMGVVSLPMLLVTFGMGYCIRFGWLDVSVITHVKMGLAAVVLLMLTHTTTMFYFMGTGSAVKYEVRDRDLDTSFLRRARAFKGWFFIWLTLAIFGSMATGILGGGAHADLLRPVQDGRSVLAIAHEALAIGNLAVNLIAFVLTPINISRNNRLLDDIGGTREETLEEAIKD
jgi:hypothetical protein